MVGSGGDNSRVEQDSRSRAQRLGGRSISKSGDGIFGPLHVLASSGHRRRHTLVRADDRQRSLLLSVIER